MKDQDTKLLKIILGNIFLKKNIVIGGIIDYKNLSSNIIKFFTQSLFSHITFFDEYSNFAIGADKKRGVSIIDYSNYNSNKKFYYFTKKIDLSHISNVFSFRYVENIFWAMEILDEDRLHIFRKRYKEYYKLRRKYSRFRIFQMMYDNDFDYEKLDVKVNNFSINTYKYLDEFITLGVIKFIKRNFKKKYALGNTLSIGLTPWKLNNGEEDEFFCSEFVAAALFYAGIYPFDIKTKDPKSLTPGDIMDISSIFTNNGSKLYKIEKSNFELLYSFSYMSSSKNIKNYIFANEMDDFSFRYRYIRFNLFRKMLLRMGRFREHFLYHSIFGFFLLFLSIGIFSSFVFIPEKNIVSSYKAEIFQFEEIGNVFVSMLLYGLGGVIIFCLLIYILFEIFAFFSALKAKNLKEEGS